MVTVGDKINTDFRLKIFAEGHLREATLCELLTRRTVVSIYMRNNTPSCDRQVESLAAHADDISRMGCNVIALSRDTCGSHARYAAKKGVRFILASDPDDRFAQAIDAVVEKTMYGRKFQGPLRSAWIVDPDGTIVAIIEKMDTQRHGAQVIAALAALQMPAKGGNPIVAD